MFKFLKDKLNAWKEKIKEKESEELQEKVVETPTEKIKKEEKKSKETKKKEEKTEKKQKKGKGKKSEEEVEERAIEISPQMEFNHGLQKYEHDIKKLEELKERLEKNKEENIILNQPVPSSQEEIVTPDVKEAEKELEQELERKEETKEGKKEKGFFKRLKESFIKKPETIEEEIRDEKIEEEAVKKIIVPPPTEEKESLLQRIGQKINTIEISEKEFETYSEELESLLLENNVALEVVEKIISNLKEDLVGKKILKKEFDSEFDDALKDSVRKILVDGFDIIEKIKEKHIDNQVENKSSPYVILLVGINGSGKTTTIAKLANYLKRKGKTCVLAAADTFRAASIEQLKTHGEKLNIPVIAQQYGSDPAAVGFDAIAYAKKHHIDIVLIDTAGRMHTASNLLKEMEKIARVTKPDLKIFIGESITGNDATEQAKSFNETINIDAIILAKADVDEKGGTALSVGYVTGKPIIFLGTGQEYDDLEPFDKERFIEKLGM